MAPSAASTTKTLAASSISTVHILLKDPNTFLRYHVRSFKSLLQTHTIVLTSGLLSSPVTAGLILNLSSSLAPLSYSLLLFHHLRSPIPTFSINSLLHSISLVSSASFTIPFFSSLLESFTPNPFTFLPLITSCARSKALSPGVQLHTQSLRRGIIPSFHVSNALIHFYSSCNQFATARKLFDEMPYRDIVSYNTMTEAYFSHGDIYSAYKVFDRMQKRNVVTWNILINGYIKSRNPERALYAFRNLKKIKSLKGTAATMVSAVTACARLGRLKSGKEIHGFFVRNFEEDNLIFWTALVDMYGKCRKVDIARKVFDKIHINNRNLVTWNSMIMSYCLYGDPLEGIKLFHKLIYRGDSDEKLKLNILPDGVTYIAIICACARLGLLSEGQNYFNQMTQLYKIDATFAHYWILANLYKSQGFTKNAQDILKSMPLNTSAKFLAGLLGLCKFRGETGLGERIAKRLIELDPCNNSYKDLLCSVYVASGNWKDVRKIKKENKGELGVGHRLTDLNQIAYTLELSKDVCVILDELAMKLKDNDENN